MNAEEVTRQALRDPRLSLGARGVWLVLIDVGVGIGDPTILDRVMEFAGAGESREQVVGYLTELGSAGYLARLDRIIRGVQ